MAKKHTTQDKPYVEDFLASSLEEKLASVNGQMAMYDLHFDSSPSLKRFRSFHILRQAAKRCPNAAYNLAMFLEENARRPRRRKSRAMAFETYARAIEIGQGRLMNPDQPYDKAPRNERALRDIISRALTNVGAKVSNMGQHDRATPYFRDAVRMFPPNAISHDCLGNMGVWFSADTGVPPLEGIAEWKKAQNLGMGCHESGDRCFCKLNVIEIAEKIRKRYGDAAATKWVRDRYAASHRKGKRKGSEYHPVYRTAHEAVGDGAENWTEAAARVAAFAAEPLKAMAGRPLETKITFAASVLGNLARLGCDSGFELPSEVFEEAVELSEGVECLEPFIGEEEWMNLAPPQTEHLLGKEETLDLASSALQLAVKIVNEVPDADGTALAMGILFHIDGGFRRGINMMLRPTVDDPPFEFYYAPALFVGDTGEH